MSEETKIKIKSIVTRLLKGFIAGAIGTMSTIVIASPANFTDITILLKALLLAGIGGGIGGLLLALQKWASWTEE